MASPHPPHHAQHPPSSPFHQSPFSPFSSHTHTPIATSSENINPFDSMFPPSGSSSSATGQHSTNPAVNSIPFNTLAHNFGGASQIGFGFGGRSFGHPPPPNQRIHPPFSPNGTSNQTQTTIPGTGQSSSFGNLFSNPSSPSPSFPFPSTNHRSAESPTKQSSSSTSHLQIDQNLRRKRRQSSSSSSMQIEDDFSHSLPVGSLSHNQGPSPRQVAANLESIRRLKKKRKQGALASLISGGPSNAEDDDGSAPAEFEPASPSHTEIHQDLLMDRLSFRPAGGDGSEYSMMRNGKRSRDEEQGFRNQDRGVPEAEQETVKRDSISSHAKRQKAEVDLSGAGSITHPGQAEQHQNQSHETGSLDDSGSDVDLGVLLASLPPQVHLQLLHSMIRERPSLKPLLLSLLPPPELEYCVANIEEKLKRVIEVMPIGSTTTTSNTTASSTPTSITAGFGGFSSRPPRLGGGVTFGGQATTASGRVALGFGFGSGSAASLYSPTATTDGMISDGYVLNRIRGPVNDLCLSATTYLPYFLPGGKQTSGNSPALSSDVSQPAVAPHASVSFQYLHFVTDLLLAQLLPLLPKTSPVLAPITTLLDAVIAGWLEWINALSEHVNKAAGMYPASMVEGWYKVLEQISSTHITKETGLSQSPDDLMRRLVEKVGQVKDRWVQEVGWLIGMHPPTSDYMN